MKGILLSEIAASQKTRKLLAHTWVQNMVWKYGLISLFPVEFSSTEEIEPSSVP